MSNLTTRAGKGSPLTNNELDANFTNLNADKVEIGGDLSGTSTAPNVAKIQGRAVSADTPENGEKLVWNGTAWEPSVDPTGEPIGHANKADSTISFDSGTRTFTIAPVAASFTVWCKGVKHNYTSAQTVVIPDTTGLHFIYFNASGVLSTQMSYFTWEEHAPTAYIYWNATAQQAVYFGDERHGITLDWQTHEYLHRTRGAAIASGFGASGYTTTGAGSTDADAQIDIGGGTFFDEDLQVDIVSTNTPVAGTWQQDLSGPARIPVLYLNGSAWVIDAPTDFPFKVVSGVPQYNLYSGGTWSSAPVANNGYFVSWILATHNLTYPVVAVISQAATNQVSEAEAMTFEGLTLSGFPSVEFRPLYKVIYQHKTSFANNIKASTIAVYDLRSISAAGVAAALVQDHGNLSGLGDDDHAQYLHVSAVRSPSAAVTNSFLPSQASQSGKYLTTDGSNPSWGAIPSGSLTFTGDVTGSGNTGSSTTLTLANSGVTAGTFTKVTVDAKGRVTNGASASNSDITTALGFTPENAANKAVAGGYASLDGSGKVPSNQLPSYVDDVLEYANLAAFPGTGETGKIYIAIDTAKTYRWSGSAYVEITASPGSTDAVPEGSTNLYFTNARARAAVSASGSLSYSTATGIFSYTQPTNVSAFTNDSGYITSSALSSYLPLTGGTLSGSLTLSSGTANGVVYLNGSKVASSGTALTFDGSASYPTLKVVGSQEPSAYLQFGLGYAQWYNSYGNIGLNAYMNGEGKSLNSSVLYFAGYNNTADAYLQLFDGKVHVAGNGNVGIGTSTVPYKLTVNGTFNASGALTQGGNQVLHAGNYNDYAPKKDGTGASGTWNINVTGNAATVSGITSGQVTTALGYTPATVHRGSATVSSAGYTCAFTVTGSGLASAIRFTVQGTTSSTVVNSLVDLVVNHHQDIVISSLSGIYTVLTVRVVSDSNDSFAVLLTTNSANAANLAIDVFPLNNETITFTSSNPYSGSTLTHQCNPGFATSATGGMSGDINAAGAIYASGGNTVLHAGNYGSGYFKTINGSSIIGTGDLTVSTSDNTKLPLSGGTLTGDLLWSGIYPKIGINDGGADCYIHITDDNPTHDGVGYGGEFWLYGDKSVDASLLRAGGAAFTYAPTVSGNRVLHAGNYNDYAPKKDGTGANGTWNINITGNAATVSGITSGQVTAALGYTPLALTGLAGQTSAATGSVAGGGGRWLRVATLGTNWFYGRVKIWDSSSSGPHQSKEFTVSGAFNDRSKVSFVLLAGGSYNYVGVSKVRYLSASTYDPQYLEVYIDGAGSDTTWTVAIFEPRNASAVGFSTGSVPSGYTSVEWDCHGAFAAGSAAGGFRIGYDNSAFVNGNTVLHAGNYNDYAPSKTGTGAQGTWGISITGSSSSVSYDFSQNQNLNATGATNNLSAFNAYYPSGGGYNQPVGGGQHFRILQFGRYNTTDGNYWRGQIAQSFYEDRMWFRKEYSQTWGSWRELIHDGNYNSYALPLSGGTVTGVLTATGGSKITVQNQIDGGSDRGIFLWSNTDANWGIYMAQSGTGRSLSGGTAPASIDGRTAHAVRFRAYGSDSLRAFIWENDLNQCVASLTPDTGNFYTRGQMYAGNSTTNLVLHTGNYSTWALPTGGGTVSGSLGVTGFLGVGGNPGSDDGGWGARLNVGGNPHARIDARCANDGIVTTVYSHQGQNRGYVGTMSNHRLALGVNGSEIQSLYSGFSESIGSYRAPIFYDSGDTTYYVNPNDYSVLYGLSTYYIKNNYDVGTDHPFGVYFATGLSTAYAIYREPGAWNWPYPDLRIAFHTGIKLGANSSYQGVRFYTDYDMSSQVMSVNNGSDPLGGGNVYVNSALQAGGSLRAPIFYDSNDTGYYLDGASTSRLNYVVPNRIKCVNNVNNEPRWDFSAYVVEAQHWYGNNSSMTMYLGESNYINIRNTADVHGDVRSPVYYDRNNTAYYLDPTSTTAIRTVGSWRADAADWDGEFNGKIQYHASHWYFQYASLAIFRNSGGSNVLQIDQSGNLTASGNVTAYSDRRLKDNVRDLTGAKAYLDKISAKRFTWKDDGYEDIGFIAQDVEAAGLTEFVIETADYDPNTETTSDPVKALDYGRMVSVLWQAVKEQELQISSMSDEIKSLKERLH